MRRLTRRRKWLLAFVGLVSVLVLSGFATGIISFSAHVWRHDPVEAAATAEEFADAAFVHREVDRAYKLMSPGTTAEVTPGDLASLLGQMHPSGSPGAERAVEFQRLPGFRGMNIYLVGESGGATFYYRLLMTGTADDGYAVAGLFRGTGPYPQPEQRDLLP
jgi:hypothetical protein